MAADLVHSTNCKAREMSENRGHPMSEPHFIVVFHGIYSDSMGFYSDLMGY